MNVLYATSKCQQSSHIDVFNLLNMAFKIPHHFVCKSTQSHRHYKQMKGCTLLKLKDDNKYFHITKNARYEDQFQEGFLGTWGKFHNFDFKTLDFDFNLD